MDSVFIVVSFLRPAVWNYVVKAGHTDGKVLRNWCEDKSAHKSSTSNASSRNMHAFSLLGLPACDVSHLLE